ncbi:hypothetical protein D3C80_1179090 [compost metagenome]
MVVGHLVGLGHFAVQAIQGDFPQAAGPHLAQGGALFHLQGAVAQQLVEGLAGARVVRTHRTVEPSVRQHTAQRLGLGHALRRQRYSARVEWAAVGVEVIDMAMPNQIAAATLYGQFSHGPAPWGC